MSLYETIKKEYKAEPMLQAAADAYMLLLRMGQFPGRCTLEAQGTLSNLRSSIAEFIRAEDQLVQEDFEEAALKAGPLQYQVGKSGLLRDHQIIREAVENLESAYHDLATDRFLRDEVYKTVKVPDTGNNQADYENVRNQVKEICMEYGY